MIVFHHKHAVRFIQIRSERAPTKGARFPTVSNEFSDAFGMEPVLALQPMNVRAYFHANGTFVHFQITSFTVFKMLSFLIDHGHLEAVNHEHMTPLMNAAAYDKLEIAKELIQAGVNVNKKRQTVSRKKGGQTALFYAVENDNYDMAVLLLNHGALQTATHDGRTPLHEAWNPTMANLLIKHGGDVNAQTDENESPLHVASHYGLLHYVTFLISIGLDKNAVSNYGTPLQMALVNGQINVVDFFLKIGCTFEFTEDDDVLLAMLRQNIDNAYESDSGNRLKSQGVYETVQTYLTSIPILIKEATCGNVSFFIEKLYQGIPFYPMQVTPYLSQAAKSELSAWATARKSDMHNLYLCLHSFPLSPITETLKQMILLPKSTRLLLNEI
jgi:ankyrin repeat protein